MPEGSAAAGRADTAGRRWRRRYPFAVALITIVPGAISAFAGGAGLIALFNIALRGSRRQVLVATALAVVVGIAFALVYPSDDALAIDIVLAVLFPAFVVPWGLFARAQRDLLRSAHERALRLEDEQRRHVEHARGCCAPSRRRRR